MNTERLNAQKGPLTGLRSLGTPVVGLESLVGPAETFEIGPSRGAEVSCQPLVPPAGEKKTSQVAQDRGKNGISTGRRRGAARSASGDAQAQPPSIELTEHLKEVQFRAYILF